MKVHPLSSMKKISPLQQIGTKLNKMANRHNANQRSAFAESAYAHATTQRSNRSGSNNIMYYEDDTAINHQDNIVHAEFQPLTGSSICIIANTSSYDKVTDPRVLALMEERESLGCAITSMGGQWIHKLEDGDVRTEVTHAIWIGSEDDNKQIQQRQRQLSHISSETLIKLNICQEKSIPIISPSWLDAIGELQPGEHWSDVNMEEHIPKIIRLFNSHSEVKPQRSSLGSSRRDDSNKLSNSIKRTYESLLEEDPDLMEEEHIKRALEVSMLDFAIVHHTHTSDSRKSVPLKNDDKKVCPYDILQLIRTLPQSTSKRHIDQGQYKHIQIKVAVQMSLRSYLGLIEYCYNTKLQIMVIASLLVEMRMKRLLSRVQRTGTTASKNIAI